MVMQMRFMSTILAASLAAALSGCSSSSSPPATSISGAVSAPGGAIAFNAPTGFKRFFAQLLGSPAVADGLGVSSVGSGVTVNLIEIDATGAQVGDVLATATTDTNGAFSITVPDGIDLGPQYVIRAEGSGSSTMDAMVTGTTVNVDPSTQATKTLVLGSVTTSEQLAALTAGTVDALQTEVDQLILDSGLTVSGSDPISTVVTNITAAGANDETVTNLANSIAAAGVISGSVTDASGTPLAGVKVIARDYGNWVTRSATKTDTSGNYTLNVPTNSSYIVGAINPTTSTAASAWWTSACETTGCSAANQFSAAKVDVATTTVTKNFKLPAGVRIVGTVTGGGSTTLQGIKVMLRDFTNDQPVTGVYTNSTGNYRINLMPGTYTLAAVNQKSLGNYGGIYYSSSDGTNSSKATPIAINSGTRTINLDLPAGHLISGQVTDSSSAVTGIPVRIYSAAADATKGSFVQAIRTDLAGNYQIVLPVSTYDVKSRGQIIASLNNSTDQTSQDFTVNVGTVTATLDDGTNPVGQAKVFVWKVDTTSNPYVFTNVGFEVSNSDGTVSIFAPDSSGFTGTQFYVVEAVMDGGQAFGTGIYTGATTLAGGAHVAITAGNTTALGAMSLDPGGVLTGTVTDPNNSNAPYANAVVQVRTAAGGGNNRIVTTRTSSDGSYTISLPTGLTYSVCAMATSSGGVNTCTAGAGVAQIQTSPSIATGNNTLDFSF